MTVSPPSLTQFLTDTPIFFANILFNTVFESEVARIYFRIGTSKYLNTSREALSFFETFSRCFDFKLVFNSGQLQNMGKVLKKLCKVESICLIRMHFCSWSSLGYDESWFFLSSVPEIDLFNR